MVKKQITTRRIAALAALLFLSGIQARSEETKVGTQFLFFIEEAYLQEAGEWELSAATVYQEELPEADFDAAEWNSMLELEYGLARWLELEVELPWMWWKAGDKEESGLADVEGSLKFLLLQEREQSLRPTLSASVGVSLPSGDWKKGLGMGTTGYELGLGLGKDTGNWIFLLSGTAEYFPGAKTLNSSGQTEKEDEFEIAGGAAIVYQAIEDASLILELSGEYEEEEEAGVEESEIEMYLTPGIKFEPIEGLELGGGIPIGLNDDSYQWGVFLKLIAEW